MESEGVLRHLAFFEVLGKMEETDPGWRSVSAGLVTMRLVDAWIADGRKSARIDSWHLSAVREAIAEIEGAHPVRGMLSSIVDLVVSSSSGCDFHSLCPRLMAYAQTLLYDAKWSIAADVYQTVVTHAHPVDDSDIVVAAFVQLGFCLRTLGDFDRATVAYAQASRVALAAGDLIGVLRGRLGDARIAIARGNLPYAESIVEDALARAEANGLEDMKARALNDRAHIAGLRGHHDLAIRYSYDALRISPAPRDRDRTLSNIATGFRYLGLVDVARDAYLVLAATAQEQYVRWMAELNLMELAATQGIELHFDKYRRDLENADFTPLLRVTYLLHVGRGYHALGRSEAGVPHLERAVEMASAHSLNQLMFEAEAALSDATIRRRHTNPERDRSSIRTVQPVIDAIHEMKELAGIGG
jgi:tetratricopeptide (TPR) repeat protein